MANGKPAVDHVTDLQAQRPERWDRREFVKGLSAVAGSAGLLGYDLRPAAAEPPPETTRLRIMGGGAVVTCIAPLYAPQEQLLRAEGFTDLRYVEYPTDTSSWPPEVLLSGEADISLSFPLTDILHIDAGAPVVILAGSHIGCVELVASNQFRSTLDLRGKTLAIPQLGRDAHLFMSLFVAYVGLNPQKDINWVVARPVDYLRLLTEGKIDALMAVPPFAQELRAKKLAHVLVKTTTDAPWSQYFCCLVASTKEFVRKHPVATKRALRAIVKGADVCALEPRRVARLIADKGFARYDYTTIPSSRYGKSRTGSGENTIPRIRCVSSRCACATSDSSRAVRRRSLPRGPTGGS
jgi:NitT/TauT family transport system substrate-binding protein